MLTRWPDWTRGPQPTRRSAYCKPLFALVSETCSPNESIWLAGPGVAQVGAAALTSPVTGTALPQPAMTATAATAATARARGTSARSRCGGIERRILPGGRVVLRCKQYRSTRRHGKHHQRIQGSHVSVGHRDAVALPDLPQPHAPERDRRRDRVPPRASAGGAAPRAHHQAHKELPGGLRAP